jgi:hypothetical protein
VADSGIGRFARARYVYAAAAVCNDRPKEAVMTVQLMETQLIPGRFAKELDPAAVGLRADGTRQVARP